MGLPSRVASLFCSGKLQSSSLSIGSYPIALANVDGLAFPAFFNSIFTPQTFQARFSKHPYKPKSREVFHPHISAPEHIKIENNFGANLNPLQTFIPSGYYRNMRVDSMRAGEYLGEDYPFNLLPKWKHWRRRKYNITYNNVPWMISDVKGVLYYERLNVWACQWKEDGVHRIRRFRAAYGLMRSKLAAEQFRKDLEASGRVDNRRTERQLRMQYIQKKAERCLRKKKFAKISSGQF